MTYQEYMRSVAWNKKRFEVLKRDGFQCQTCLSRDALEVHHKTYDRLFNEDMEDLITLCHECHEAITAVIRRRRYSLREYRVEQVRHGEFNHVERKRISPEISGADADAQWASCRSHEQVRKSYEDYIREAGQD